MKASLSESMMLKVFPDGRLGLTAEWLSFGIL